MREKTRSLFWAMALSFAIICSSFMCVVTAFSLTVDAGTLVLFCLVFAGAYAGLSLHRYGTWIQAGLLLGGLLLSWGALENSLEALLYRITRIYDTAYGWGAVQWSTNAPEEESVTLALCALAAPVLWLEINTVLRRRPAGLAVIVGLMPLLSCMVVTDTVPATDCLFWLTASLLLLIITQTTRRQAEAAGNRLTALLLIPALLSASLLFWAVPQEGYQPPQSLPVWLEQLFASFTDTGSGDGVPNEKVDLSNIGPKSDMQFAVMDVTAQQGGLFYLRGQSFDVYTGTSWEIAADIEGTDPYFPTTGLVDAGVVTIYLRLDMDRQYLPYHTTRMTDIRYGRYENTVGRTYSLQRMSASASGPRLNVSVVRDALVDQCLALPADTQAWAEKLLKTIPFGENLSATEKAQVIADYVKSSALYDKKTDKMPAGQEDFARWFLEDGETGYCVHFATAATVLLRAAGIPARYVTGYMANIGSTKTSVLARNSHAWVEYLDYRQGWTVLDPTPAEPEPLPTESTSPTEETDPTQSTPPTQESTARPTLSSEDTDHTETIAPTDTSDTGGAQKPGQPLLLEVLGILLYVCLTVAVLLGQYALRVRLRHRKRRGDHNQRALAMWKEIVRFSKLYRKPLPEELISLAEKAKFSQHMLTAQELWQFRANLQELSLHLHKKPWYKQVLLKLIFAAE